MSKKSLVTAWIITGMVALVLAAVTLKLATRARAQAILSRDVYLNGQSPTIQLYEEPDEASEAVAVLVRGSLVAVIDSVTRSGETWYRVQKGAMIPGWVHGRHIRLDKP